MRILIGSLSLVVALGLVSCGGDETGNGGGGDGDKDTSASTGDATGGSDTTTADTGTGGKMDAIVDVEQDSSGGTDTTGGSDTTATDTSASTDTSTATDTSSGSDTTAGGDTASGSDTGGGSDASTQADSGTATDTGMAADSGGSADTTKQDAGTTNTNCNYQNNATGVCKNSKLKTNGNCAKPSDYEKDESTCDQKDNDCDGVTDENCPCAVNGKSTGVCGNGKIDASSGKCTHPDYESTEQSCDNKDNDCDGQTDENLSAQNWYVDKDGDGYGDRQSTAVYQCAQPKGYVSNRRDCNDNDKSIHPNAAEVCDTTNHDCDRNFDTTDPDADTWCQNNKGSNTSCLRVRFMRRPCCATSRSGPCK